MNMGQDKQMQMVRGNANLHGNGNLVAARAEGNAARHNDGSAEVIQICLWCVDSGCSKHMTGNLKLLINFIWKFMGTVRFENDHIAAIMGLGDLQRGNILITRVYFIEGLGHNLFSVGTKKIMEIMNVSFDELSTIAFEQRSSKPELQSMTPGQISSRLILTYASSTITSQQPSKVELDLFFEAMYDDYISGQPSATTRTVPAAQEPQVRQTSTAPTSKVDSAPTPTNSSSLATNFPNTSQDVDERNLQQQHAQQQGIQAYLQSKTVADNVSNAMFDANTLVNPFANPSTSADESSTSQNVDPSNMHTFYQPYLHEFQWTMDHPLELVIR
nr:integrase, catalytic region, zinc finger, CCHC-type, peptidase aspartic, catalytic [Tanacetum cinerariifolium]